MRTIFIHYQLPSLITFILLLFNFNPLTHGYNTFLDKLPNGRQYFSGAPGPSNPPQADPNFQRWRYTQVEAGGFLALGHIDFTAGNSANNFQADFVNSRIFCNKDSDNDGVTNGVEMGDPQCLWMPGQTPQITDRFRLSNPADPNEVPQR
eukprot:Pgem_evm1s9866